MHCYDYYYSSVMPGVIVLSAVLLMLHILDSVDFVKCRVA